MTGYSSFIDQIGAIAPYVVTDDTLAAPFQDANINLILPQVIAYAEGRIYRDPDFDFLATHTTNTTVSTVANSRLLAMPAAIIIPEALNLITPAAALPDTNGSVRVPCKRTSLAFIDAVWTTSTTAVGQGTVIYWAVYDNLNVRLAPTPSAAYVAEFVGTFTPTPLSASNTDTFLTTYLNELFFAAAMIFVSGYQRTFGAQSDDPQMAQSWEAQYGKLKTVAAVQEARKHFRGPESSPYPPTPLVGAPPAPQGA